MKKTLIALAVLGAAAGVAHAQSNVTIYGVVDTGYVKMTGQDWRMGENVNNRIGFRGSEDLGGGLKATFELEKRFDLFDGTSGNTNVGNYARPTYANSGKDWDGAANLGLAGNWGRIRFGRVNELPTETIRKFDPFYQYGVGSQLMSSLRSARIDNTARYDSPKWSGFSFGLSYSLGRDTSQGSNSYVDGFGSTITNPNDGYAANLSYDNGPLMATANWSRLADSNNSYVWNAGLAYKFGPARLSLMYENTRDKGQRYNNGAIVTAANPAPPPNTIITGIDQGGERVDTQLWLVGLEWDVGPGQFDASVQWMKYDPEGNTARGNNDGDIYKYAIGYTYNLSKRTSAYAQVAYTDFDTREIGSEWTGQDTDSVWGFQVGMTHKF